MKLSTGVLPHRKDFISAGAALAAIVQITAATTRAANAETPKVNATSRRRLGSLEVSSIGLGVQNMSRTYQMTVPSRPQMIDIIRSAYDQGVTFFDAAEAYGPLEVERILGEGVAPFPQRSAIS